MPAPSLSEQLRQQSDPAESLQEQYELSPEEADAVVAAQHQLDPETYRLVMSALESAYMTGHDRGTQER